MLYYAVGDALVEHDELEAKAGQLHDLATAVKRGRAYELHFRSGIASASNLLVRDGFAAEREEGATRDRTSAATAVAEREVTPFEAIAMGKPFAIELRHVYTGREPQRSFFQDMKDMIVTSATKGLATYTAAPRAVNMLEQAIEPRSNFTGPSAPTSGTPLIFYVPAVTQAATILTIEVMFDNFPDQLFNTVSTAFTAAAGIPVFASASVYLLAAGMITKLLGSLGHGLFDGHTGFKTTETINFARPGAPKDIADYRLLTQTTFDQATLAKYKVDASGALVDEKGDPYAGDEPYIVISLDGATRTEYEGFQPTAATAALLDQFFTVKDGAQQTAQTLIDAMKIYNDWQYRQQADDLAAQLGKLKPGSADYDAVSKRLEAAKKNILNKELQP